MKKLSMTEFQALVNNESWTRDHQTVDIADRNIVEREHYDTDGDYTVEEIEHVFGYALLKLTLGSLEIDYCEAFQYNHCEPDSFETYPSDNPTLTFYEFFVIDEDGDEIDASELVSELSSEFTSIDYSGLEIEQTTDIDVDTDGNSTMETITVRVDNQPDIRFIGECLGSTSSSSNNASGSNYSGETGRWAELAVYKTKSGKYICEQIGRTQWQGEKDRFSGAVCETLADVQAFFGHRWLAKDLYNDAQIDSAIDIE
ncbi:hypothetical protein [Endozoicomonas sp.]|uniref:hypothetical protein n=1 Tax=Endozoicomonas sp. TaxID=1892382 RepID=UPI00383B5F05